MLSLRSERDHARLVVLEPVIDPHQRSLLIELYSQDQRDAVLVVVGSVLGWIEVDLHAFTVATGKVLCQPAMTVDPNHLGREDSMNEKRQGNGPAPVPLAKVLQLSKSTRPPPGEGSGPASTPDMTAESLDPEEFPESSRRLTPAFRETSGQTAAMCIQYPQETSCQVSRRDLRRSLVRLRGAFEGFQRGSRSPIPQGQLMFPVGNGIGRAGNNPFPRYAGRSPEGMRRSPGCA